MPLIEKKGHEQMKLWKKRMIILAFALAFTVYTALSAAAVGLTYDDVSYKTAEPLVIDNGVTYVSVRALLDMRTTNTASWDGATAHFGANGLALSARVGDRYITANGERIEFTTPVRLISGRVCVPVRALASALGAQVSYDATRSHITLTTVSNYISACTGYNSDDLYWLARIIHAESCGEPYIGKLLVGNVVLNRKRSTQFPNSVYGVIFDTKNGVQFTPTSNGTIYNTPCDECTQAGKAVLSGTVRSDNAMYFVNTTTVPVSWVSLNRPVIMKYGNHTFFA